MFSLSVRFHVTTPLSSPFPALYFTFNRLYNSSSLVRPLLKPLSFSHLQPAFGSHIKRQRVGRGGTRGGSSGRGQGGQKHHNKTPGPYFTGLHTNPIIEAIPKWTWSPRNMKPVYAILTMERLQLWIDMGRLDPCKVITMKELLNSKCVRQCKDGVKLLATGSDYFNHKSVHLEVSRATTGAIDAMEKLSGSVVTVYHTKENLKYLLHPNRFNILPCFQPPVTEKDLEYYSTQEHRGYLYNQEKFEELFAPRGYLSRVDEYAAPAVFRQQFQSVDQEEMLSALDDQRVERLRIEAALERARVRSLELKKKAWDNQRWFPGQGDHPWVEVNDGKLKINY